MRAVAPRAAFFCCAGIAGEGLQIGRAHRHPARRSRGQGIGDLRGLAQIRRAGHFGCSRLRGFVTAARAALGRGLRLALGMHAVEPLGDVPGRAYIQRVREAVGRRGVCDVVGRGFGGIARKRKGRGGGGRTMWPPRGCMCTGEWDDVLAPGKREARRQGVLQAMRASVLPVVRRAGAAGFGARLSWVPGEVYLNENLKSDRWKIRHSAVVPDGVQEKDEFVPYRRPSEMVPVRYGYGTTRDRMAAVPVRPYTVYGTVNSPSREWGVGACVEPACRFERWGDVEYVRLGVWRHVRDSGGLKGATPPPSDESQCKRRDGVLCRGWLPRMCVMTVREWIPETMQNASRGGLSVPLAARRPVGVLPRLRRQARGVGRGALCCGGVFWVCGRRRKPRVCGKGWGGSAPVLNLALTGIRWWGELPRRSGVCDADVSQIRFVARCAQTIMPGVRKEEVLTMCTRGVVGECASAGLRLYILGDEDAWDQQGGRRRYRWCSRNCAWNPFLRSLKLRARRTGFIPILRLIKIPCTADIVDIHPCSFSAPFRCED
ncbi:hypothetical protein C8J57DRAFT_1589019 [Mycena rebaudengoi]|nr:hypothetical protein C8J57DRAFT_1589019 [Mycena rebaudengoi]